MLYARLWGARRQECTLNFEDGYPGYNLHTTEMAAAVANTQYAQVASAPADPVALPTATDVECHVQNFSLWLSSQ